MAKPKIAKPKPPTQGYPARELTENTRWIVCMWDIKGDPPELTAMLLKRSLRQVKYIISKAKRDGYYDKVKKHIEIFDSRIPQAEEYATTFRFFREIGNFLESEG